MRSLDARTFFGETLSAILKRTAQRGDAMRCTFTVRGAGVWYLDLRLPFQRCAEITPERSARSHGVPQPSIAISGSGHTGPTGGEPSADA